MWTHMIPWNKNYAASQILFHAYTRFFIVEKEVLIALNIWREGGGEYNKNSKIFDYDII